jgi:hypothetical protein
MREREEPNESGMKVEVGQGIYRSSLVDEVGVRRLLMMRSGWGSFPIQVQIQALFEIGAWCVREESNESGMEVEVGRGVGLLLVVEVGVGPLLLPSTLCR